MLCAFISFDDAEVRNRVLSPTFPSLRPGGCLLRQTEVYYEFSLLPRSGLLVNKVIYLA